jgi:DNA-binding NtrC family response regulator
MSMDAPEAAARIAVVEDDPAVRTLFETILRSAGHSPYAFASGDEFLARSAGLPFDVVITDFQMDGASGLDVLKACRADSDPPEVLLVTGYASIRNAVEAMRLGAFDYLAKPADPKELLHRVAQAMETRRLKRAVDALAGEVRRHHAVAPPVAESPRMREFLARAYRAAETSSTVLILGETGTGKDLIARQIQAAGPRSKRTYLTVNCAALPEHLLESELFGHARGAFSGAHAMKRGLFEEASGGTLFLDEIGSMSSGAQAKLLRVLEEGSVRRVGENHPVPVDVRILAATNRDLTDAVAAGEFREDLYYRLSVVTLVVPPLRERREDILPLARSFLAESVRRLGKLRVFAPEVPALLESYDFPGNVRELRYAIEQAAILSEDGTIRPSDFALTGQVRNGAGGAGRAGAPRPHGVSRDITAEKIERALAESGGNRVRAARALGISRATFYRLLDRQAKDAGGGGEVSGSDV